MKVNFAIDNKKIDEILSTIGFSTTDPNFQLEKILSSPLTIMADEINRFILSNSDKFNSTPKQIFLFGEGYNVKNLDTVISKHVSLPVTNIDINPIVIPNTVSNFFKNDWPIFISAMGGVIE